MWNGTYGIMYVIKKIFKLISLISNVDLMIINYFTVLEYMAVSKRTLVVNVAFGLYFAIASTILPWMAYYISNWRYFTYVTAIPLLSVIITPWILPESAR